MDKSKAQTRVHDVQLAAGSPTIALTELPMSKNGYVFVL